MKLPVYHEDGGAFLPATQVQIRYSISETTLWRWLRDPDLGFPRPSYIGRLRFFRLSELENWERALPKTARHRSTVIVGAVEAAGAGARMPL